MNNAINTAVWRPFVVGELFSQIRGKEKAPKQNLDGNTPLIQETNSNNGFDRYVKPTKAIKGNSITVSINYAQNVFYQPKDYCASVNIVSLHNESLNQYNGKFVATVLANAHKKYTYTNKISKDRLNTEIIRLPAIAKLTPDYQKLEILAGGGIDMSKIDTSSWKEFKLADIAKLENGNKLDIGKMTQLSPSINFVSRTAKNNGVSSIVDKIEGIEPYPAGCLTLAFGGSVGSCFLQERPFYTGQNVGVIMFSEEISLEAKKYVATSLGNKCKLSYQAFGNEINRHFKTDLSVKLPTIETYEPDWQYMEKYMKNIESEVTSKIDKFQMIFGNKKHKIDTQKWGEYRIGDLFEIHPTKAYKMTNNELIDDGEFPVVVNSSYNNGIGGTSTQSTTESGNMITFSDTVDANTIFYQEKPFIGYAHVQGLYPIGKYKDSWSKYSLLFFLTSFRQKALSLGFDYGNKFRRDIATNIIVKLPVDINGNPDWDYMENYINNIKCKVCQNISSMEGVDANG